MRLAERRTALFPAMIVILAMLQLPGCGRQEGEWRRVRADDSAAAYEDYLRRHPEGPHSEEAGERLRALREEREWERASRLNAPEAFQQYLGAYPEGRFAAQARERLADFLLAQAPSAAPEDVPQEAGNPAVVPAAAVDTAAQPAPSGDAAPALTRAVAATRADVAQKPAVNGATASRGEPRAAARADATTGSNHRLQLGAFGGGEDAARRAWDRLHGIHGDLLGPLTPRIDSIRRDGRTLWRLRAGPVDVVRAANLCTALRARGAACIVVRP